MSRYADISPEEHEQDEDQAPEERRGISRSMDLGHDESEAEFWSDQEPHLDEYASGHFGHLNGLSERSEC